MIKTAAGWELDVDRGPDWLLVKVRRADARKTPDSLPLVDLLWSVLEQHFTYRLVLELDAVRSFGDGIIEQLLELHDRINHHGGVLRICGLSPQLRRALTQRQLGQLDDRLVPYSDREEAVLGHSHAPRNPR